ncbi:NAD(P)/FAD-dependent oxidoreductase [Marinibaculum pumilum]|uniref:NAD(P)/FAD-dependent oxidoreductase n=1 Tax=Marinibaculum pumilum TaxID=1766165 RepID=A0ABV7KUZ5_9PROT
MTGGLVVAGGGFAGLWAALAAVREAKLAGAELPVTLLSPEPWLVMRPRLYERDPAKLREDLRPLLQAAGIRFVAGAAEDAVAEGAGGRLRYRDGAGEAAELPFDRLVVATGSRMTLPPVPGLAEHGFDVDSHHGALKLDRHLAALAAAPADAEHGGFVVVGGGFTGIEMALELRDRIAAHAGAAAAQAAAIHLVERSAEVGPELGANPRPVILEALQAAGVQLHLGRQVAEVTDRAALLDDGTMLPAATVIAATGMAAAMPWPGLKGPRDATGRIVVAPELRLPEAPAVFAAGDAARAELDEAGNTALMSCQHALRMGRFAGRNAACDLLGLELRPYRQPDYVTCLDLGRSGAVLTRGWTREVAMNGAEAKALKRRINTEVIYPPPPAMDAVMEMADVDYTWRR